ncbi:hypothetical protein TWF730_003789, partial [Orbilia blumenaviensis]
MLSESSLMYSRFKTLDLTRLQDLGGNHRSLFASRGPKSASLPLARITTDPTISRHRWMEQCAFGIRALKGPSSERSPPLLDTRDTFARFLSPRSTLKQDPIYGQASHCSVKTCNKDENGNKFKGWAR